MPSVTLEEHPLGISWITDEAIPRTSHALADGGKVWLVDPVVDEGALGRAAELGEVVAVLQLLDRHNRDCLEIARRLDVPHLKVPDHVPASPFETIPAVRIPGWKETALWWPERSALVVAEVLGTTPLYTAGQGAVGMHVLLRPLPPGTLREFEPEHLLVSHGGGVHGPDAAKGIQEAYERARADLPHVLKQLPGMLRG